MNGRWDRHTHSHDPPTTGHTRILHTRPARRSLCLSCHMMPRRRAALWSSSLGFVFLVRPCTYVPVHILPVLANAPRFAGRCQSRLELFLRRNPLPRLAVAPRLITETQGNPEKGMNEISRKPAQTVAVLASAHGVFLVFLCRSADMGSLIKKPGVDWEMRVLL